MIRNLNNSEINIENEKNKLINIYLLTIKKIKNCLIRFLKIIKEKNINYEFNDDLQFIF